MVDELDFALLSRFCILSLYKKDSITQEKEVLAKKIIEKTKLKVESIEVKEIVPFNFKDYDSLGYFEIKLKKFELAEMSSMEKKKQTFPLYQFSQVLEEISREHNKNSSENGTLFLDVYNPPYIVNVAVESSTPQIQWDIPTVKRYSKALSRWIEFYSGQWPDYSEELYDSRITDNLSNRLSEVHFIRVNSAFIFLNESWWNDKGGSYMEQYFIHQILRVKALAFCYYVLNLEIDNSNSRLESQVNPSLVILEKEIEYVSKLERSLAKLSDQLFKEQIINRRAHGKRVLELSLQRFEIDPTRTETGVKIDRLNKRLEETRAVQQQKHAAQQKMWMLILNILIGSSVLFTVQDKLAGQLTDPQSFLFGIIGTDISNSILGILDPLIWTFIVLIALIAVIGIGYGYIRQKIG